MKTNILTLAITLTLGVILAGSLLMPVISEAQNDLGDPITKTNESVEYLSLSKGDVTMTFEDGDLTINGELYEFITTDRIVFSADLVTIWYNGTNCYGSWTNAPTFTPGVANIDEFSISVSDNVLNSTITYRAEGGPYTYTLTDMTVKFAFYLDPDGDYAFFSPSTSQPFVSSIKDVVATGTFYTGTNKTNYWYYNGEAGGIKDSYTYGFNATLTLAEGTSDIYTISDITFDISDEEFTPFYMIVIKDVEGHATSGAAYSLLGAIPFIVIIGLVLAATAAIFTKRDD